MYVTNFHKKLDNPGKKGVDFELEVRGWFNNGRSRLSALNSTKDSGTMGKFEKSATTLFAEFAAKQTFDDLPNEVVQRTKEIFLDTLGIMVRASSFQSHANLRELLVDQQCSQSTVFGSVRKANPFTAALLNASLPTITQYDEGHRMARGHPAIHIVPVALALGEDKGISGKDLILSIVAGYEVAVRIAFALYPMKAEIHPHGNWAIIGAAVAAGKILSFSEKDFEELLNSISNLTLSTWRKATTCGATSHHLAPGLGALHAVIVALAVKAGWNGPPSCLEEYFVPSFSTRRDAAIITNDLGSNYQILNNYFKSYPACAHTHSSIEALEKILEGHPIDLNEIESIEVRTYAEAFHLGEQNPSNTLAGMFSVPYCLAVTLLRRRIPLDSIVTDGAIDPEILQATSLVRLIKDETLKPAFPIGRPSLVRIRLKNGKEYEQFIALTRERLTAEELTRKFLEMVEGRLGEKSAKQLSKRIGELENVADIGELSALWSA